jgi:uncharacterized iron-regulated membrane protein
LVVGSVVLVMAVTGILYAYQRQIIAVAERDFLNPAPSAKLLSPAAVLERVHATVPNARASDLTIRRDPAAPAVVGLGRDRAVLFDRSTGVLLGEATWLRGFLHQVEQMHRNLLLGERGKIITGASALAFLGLIATGLYLWFPRRLVKAILRPRWGLRGKTRDFNWHNAFGFWASLPLLILALTGTVMSYEWANGLLFRATGNEPPPPRKAPPKNDPRRVQPSIESPHLDRIWAAAEAFRPDWKTIRLRVQNPNAPAMVMVEWGEGGRPTERVMLNADLRTGAILKTETFESYNMGRKARMWVKPIHTGEAGGLLGQTLAALTAGCAIVLVWTGFALSWRRFFPRSKPPEVSNQRRPIDRPAGRPDVVEDGILPGVTPRADTGPRTGQFTA